ncbi:MAG: hypothetical protein WCA81_18180 [Rhizomicrobium sp.]
MIGFLAPSIPWLLAHELRLMFRGNAKGKVLTWVIGATLLAALSVFAGFPLALYLRNVNIVPTPMFIEFADGAILLLATFILSQSLSMTTRAFFERGDLDLLLSSPIPPSRVLFVRCLAIAVTPLIFYMLLASPFVLPLAADGHWPILAAYGMLIGLGLTCASAGLLLAMALFRLIGPRRTKTVGQILAAIMGAIIFLVSQAANLLPGHGRGLFVYLNAAAKLGYFRPDGILSWPARALLGEPVPFFLFFAASVLFFTLVVNALGARFAIDASLAAGVSTGLRGKRASAPIWRFRSGLRIALIRKELRLIGRDPALISQLLLRLLYFVPLAFIMLRNARFGTSIAVAGAAAAVVLLASQIASSLAWITISAEDAPDLLRSAPVSPRFVRRVKLVAALLPVAVLSAVPIGIVVGLRPWAGLVTALGVAASSYSVGLINLWYERPQPRKNFVRRRGGSFAASMGEMFVGMTWAAATFTAAAGWIWALAVCIVPLGLMGLLSLGKHDDSEIAVS